MTALAPYHAVEEAQPLPKRPGLFARARIWLSMTVIAAIMRVISGREMADALRKKRGEAYRPPEPIEPFGLHFDANAEPERLLTRETDDPAFLIEQRVSTLADRPDWILVEFINMMSGLSLTAALLSEPLPGTDVYYFRRTYTQTLKTQHDYHLYRDGQPIRRVMAHKAIPTDGDDERR